MKVIGQFQGELPFDLLFLSDRGFLELVLSFNRREKEKKTETQEKEKEEAEVKEKQEI